MEQRGIGVLQKMPYPYTVNGMQDSELLIDYLKDGDFIKIGDRYNLVLRDGTVDQKKHKKGDTPKDRLDTLLAIAK